MAFSPPAGAPMPAGVNEQQLQDELVGFVLVVGASLGICAALNIQKYVHTRNVDPATGCARRSFLRIPLWWGGMVLNTASELANLAALGYAPAALVTPLGCLTVVFNSLSSNLLLGEPCFRRDLLGIALICAGVTCVVFSQSNTSPVTISPDYLRDEVFRSAEFYGLLICVFVLLALLKVFVHNRWCKVYSWVYLLESSLVSIFTVISARAFASMLPPPMPGKLSYFFVYPDLLYGWLSLLVLVASAVGGLMLQNFALMHFSASEVVPVYFSMFVVAGVAASAFAFREIDWPWVLLLLPGVVCCIAGVFAIAYKREERHRKCQASLASFVESTPDPSRPAATPPCHGSAAASSHAAAAAATPPRAEPTPARLEECASAPKQWLPERILATPEALRRGISALSALSRDYSAVNETARLSEMSHASFVSHSSSLSELTLGGGSFSSFGALYRMRRDARLLAGEGLPTEALLRTPERASERHEARSPLGHTPRRNIDMCSESQQ
ncbi:hypothetical protein AB1Y20_017891 [Prymnesium parvum]|uniref:Magnesium transporter n=1 Tax=Prymnesium parvum TaxID=97485 RepID=A0AB34JNC3_PRYPA